MNYTVKELAKISNVSVRMLHFYDEIGLLRPKSRGENGYRYYGEEQLLILQQILFYRELGISLNEIGDILKRSDFNKIEALKNHKSILLDKINHEKRLIQTINETIDYLEGKTKMEHKEFYQGFVRDQKEFEQYLIESGKVTIDQIQEQRTKVKELEEKLIKEGEVEEGEYVFERYMIQNGMITQEEIKQQRERIKNTSMQENEELKDKAKEMQNELVALVVEKRVPDSVETQNLLDHNYDLANAISPLTRQKFVEVTIFYLKTPQLRKVWDDLHPDLADFVDKANKVYAARYGLEV